LSECSSAGLWIILISPIGKCADKSQSDGISPRIPLSAFNALPACSLEKWLPMENNQDFIDIINLMWKTCIAEGLTPESLDKKGLILRPDSMAEKKDRQQYLLNNQPRVQGDYSLLMRLAQRFGKKSADEKQT